MKNINVCLLAAVACTYSIQASANSYEHNFNFVIEDSVYSLRNSPTASHTVTPLELEPILFSSKFIKLAAVCHITDVGCTNIGFNSGDDDLNLNTAAQCIDEGYSLNTCNEVQIASEVCPHNKLYNKGCVCKSGLISCSSVQDGVGSACNSQYASCVCKSTLVSCNDAQDGIGSNCGGRYNSCACKPSLIACTTNQIGTGTSCGGKYTSCTCPASWSTCSETGGASAALVCTTAGGTKYYNNCRPKDDNCPSGYTKSACNASTPIETARSTTEAGSTCYQCRARTCTEENQRCSAGTWNLDFYYANQALKCLMK